MRSVRKRRYMWRRGDLRQARDPLERYLIAEGKKHLVSILADVATVGAERMSEKIGKASLRDAAIGTGVAVDKMLALTGQTPALQIANLIMPTEQEREERRLVYARLDAIARRLMESCEPKP